MKFGLNMTLPDHEEKAMPDNKTSSASGQCLVKVLTRARNDGRLVCGVFDSARHLNEQPDVVMVCVLPVTAPSDIGMSIQHKLIQAYCYENDIPVIKVKNCEKLASLLEKGGLMKSEADMPVTTPSLDASCLLVEWPPKPQANKHENRLLDMVWGSQTTEFPI